MMLWVSASHSFSICLICSAVSQFGRVGRQHPFEQRGPRDDPVGQGHEIVEELLFPGNQAKSHRGILS